MEKKSDQPRIVFKQIKGFQAIDDQGKVKTILFLNASREVVTIIGEFIWCFFTYHYKNAFIYEINILWYKKSGRHQNIQVT